MFFLDFEDKLENLNNEKEILIKSSKLKNIDISSKIKSIEGKEHPSILTMTYWHYNQFFTGKPVNN